MIRRMRAHVLPIVVAVLGSACGDDIPDPMPDGSSTSAATLTDSTASPTSDGPSSTSTTDDVDTTVDGTTADTGFEPSRPECGNGYVEGDEQCDDANVIDDDACSNACLIPCGIDHSVLVPGPTLDSQVDGLFVAAAPDGGVAVAAFVREITTDQRGNPTVFDDVVYVLRWDARGRLVWQTTLASTAGDVDAGGIAVDEAGEVYVATTVDEPAPSSGRAIEVVRLAAGDGATTWTHAFVGDVEDGNDIATGIAIAPDGDIVVAGHVRVADGDNDIWVRKLDFTDGSERWTVTHGGAGSGGFSTDTGGPLAVGPDGTVYVLGRIYVDFQTMRVNLLRFDADGGGLAWAYEPTLPGVQQNYFALGVVVDPAGDVVLAFDRIQAFERDFHVHKVDARGQLVWALDREAFIDAGSDWALTGLAIAGDDLVAAGSRRNDFTIGQTAWTEVWVARLNSAGETRCQIAHTDPVRGLVPASTFANRAAGAVDGAAFVTGALSSEAESGIWVARFRP